MGMVSDNEIGRAVNRGHPHPPLVKVESNIEEWPVFQLGRSKSTSSRVEHRIVGEDGSELIQRLEVSAAGKYRLPGRFDYDVYSAVLELLEIRGGMPEGGALNFSLHELILILGIEPSGKTYDEVKRSLRRIAATVLDSDNAFWSKGQNRHIQDTFNLWNVRFDSVTDKNGSGSRHEIEFGKLFQRSFEEHYLRGLDITFFWSLDSPVAKRLYRLIDLKRNGGTSWDSELFDLQRSIPIGPYNYVSKIKEKLKAAHEELVAKGFLSDVRFGGKSGIVYEVSEAFRSRRKDLELSGTHEEIIAIKLLTESGLRGDVARDLVARHGPEHCTLYANALPRQRNVRNPAGWLRRAIEDSYKVDSGPLQTVLDIDPPERRVDPPTDSADLGPSRPRLEDPTARAAWDSLIEELNKEPAFDSGLSWFSDFTPTSLNDTVLTVVAPNSFAVEYIQERFDDLLVRAWRRQVGQSGMILIEPPE